MACANIQMRFIIGGMVCVACMINFMVRGNMSLIILAMTKPLNNTSAAAPPPDYGPRYEWSAYDQSLVLGSFFWGAVVVSSFVGALSERYGARKVAGIAIILAAILSALAPISAQYLWLSIVIRFLTGMSISTISTVAIAVIANWVPPEERGKFLGSLTINGIGTVIEWSMAGYIIEYFGWPYAFYAVVLILGVFVILWFLIVYDSPKAHPRITSKEEQFISSKLHNTVAKGKKTWPPVKLMLSSIPIWALVILYFGTSFSQYFFMTATPRYLSEVHNFRIGATGVLSSVPYITRFIFGIGFGFITDFLYSRNIMSSRAIRKYFLICSNLIPAFFLIGLSFAGSMPYLCVVFLALAQGFTAANTITSLQNAYDLSPNFAATIFSFMNTLGSTTGFIAPLIVAYFTKEQSTEKEWRNVFFVGAGLLIVSALIFIVFGKVEIQKWNTIEQDELKDSDHISISDKDETNQNNSSNQHN